MIKNKNKKNSIVEVTATSKTYQEIDERKFGKIEDLDKVF